jgi:3-phosphoshikimate 1-carboxyvinyltransferase
MAQAAVIAGLVVDDVRVEDIGTTSKTFPDFPAAWSAFVG